MQRTNETLARNLVTWLMAISSLMALVAMLAESATAQRPRPGRSADNPKVKVGEFAPDFELPKLTFKTDADGKHIGVISETDTVKLSSFRGKKPVCMIMSSYT
ncbi:MAG: hypothetical protein CEE38_05555 [Planctomycetes bacterium B3_Pla]|nr:MAG: hypothetical protein CEE38_05555 [Planctomycetes bacterium B3_Pla]